MGFLRDFGGGKTQIEKNDKIFPFPLIVAYSFGFLL